MNKCRVASRIEGSAERGETDEQVRARMVEAVVDIVRESRSRTLTGKRLTPREALAMVKRRSAAAGIGRHICNHSFRATGITNFLQNGGSLENAQAIAAHESPRTTKLYDRTRDEISLDEIERVRF
jgi:site-specific recombinase XerD